MAFSTNDLKNGMSLNLPEGLFSVVEFQHVKPGKGGAFVRTKLHPFLWDPVLLKILYAPAFLDLAVLGLLLMLISQPRRESDGLRPL